MGSAPTPRQIAKDLLNGVRPPRPLFLPVVFALGAKVENLALDAYLKNPTKIVSALRQMQTPSGSDGVICYFDSSLEIEALGSKSMPIESLAAAENVPRQGRIPVAIEVIRRLNALPNRDFLLAAGVTGPLTLAATISGATFGCRSDYESIPDTVKELAASVSTQVANASLEAGADLILLCEPTLPKLSPDAIADGAGLLAPAINATRFFEALPVLFLADASSTIANWDAIFARVQDAVICVPLEAAIERQRNNRLPATSAAWGVVMPVDCFASHTSIETPGATDTLRSLFAAESPPAFVTTSGEIQEAAHLKSLAQCAAQLPHEN